MNNLTPAETEQLGKLNEELGELQEVVGRLQKAIGKTLIHGFFTEFQEMYYNNKADIEREFGDVIAAGDLLVKKGTLDGKAICAHRDAKIPKITRYMKHQLMPV